MLPGPDPIPNETLRQLHRDVVSGADAVRELLIRVQRSGGHLVGGIDRSSEPRLARIASVGSERVSIRGERLGVHSARQLAFHFELEDERFFFVGRVAEPSDPGCYELELPHSIYVAEKRELSRLAPAEAARAPSRVEIRPDSGSAVEGQVSDWSYHGMAVDVPASSAVRMGPGMRVRPFDGAEAGSVCFADACHRAEVPDRPGWVRVGLSVTRVPRRGLIRVERFDRIPVPQEDGLAEAASVSDPATSRRVEFPNDRREALSGIVDQWGDAKGSTAVLVPAAWGRTKETLLPLAATIVESFRAARLPVVVLRFDGTRRRGGSYLPPECTSPGSEYLRFTFSQAVEDLSAALSFLRKAPDLRCGRVVVVTSSLSAVEARRVIARDGGRDVAGWISLVGIADLQSALQVISGGVDFGHGLLKRLRFGRQELFGVLVDIDEAGEDSIAHGLTFLEDARRDMAAIRVPVHWISGRFDAWVDLERVRSLMSCGDRTRRRLIELPIGHELRASREAFDVFRLIAGSVAEMSLGSRIGTVRPPRASLVRRRKAERAAQASPPLRAFWREYLLGRGGALGVEMLTATGAYSRFMGEQTRLLDLREGQRILDLGSGTGEFVVQLLEAGGAPQGLRVEGVDYVAEAHARARQRLAGVACGALRYAPFLADLDLANGWGLPVREAAYDRVVASLLINYVSDPERLLREIRRATRPGGVTVVSSLRRDADISKIYVDALRDRYSGRAQQAFGAGGGKWIDRSLPSFLNSASKLLEFENQGRFHFFDASELGDLMRSAGFAEVEVTTALGDPPQAVVARGLRL